MSILKKMNTPVFTVEGVQHLDVASHTLTVSGLTGGDRVYSMAELKAAFPHRRIDRRLTSVSGWSVRAGWDGILWADFTAAVTPLVEARYALFTSVSGYAACVLLSDLAASETVIAWGVDGEDLEAEYGWPLRMVIPNLWGYKSCKWLTKITFTPKYVTGHWELRGYSHRGDIMPGETLDVNTRTRRRIPGGEVTEF